MDRKMDKNELENFQYFSVLFNTFQIIYFRAFTEKKRKTIFSSNVPLEKDIYAFQKGINNSIDWWMGSIFVYTKYVYQNEWEKKAVQLARKCMKRTPTDAAIIIINAIYIDTAFANCQQFKLPTSDAYRNTQKRCWIHGRINFTSNFGIGVCKIFERTSRIPSCKPFHRSIES